MLNYNGLKRVKFNSLFLTGLPKTKLYDWEHCPDAFWTQAWCRVHLPGEPVPENDQPPGDLLLMSSLNFPWLSFTPFPRVPPLVTRERRPAPPTAEFTHSSTTPCWDLLAFFTVSLLPGGLQVTSVPSVGGSALWLMPENHLWTPWWTPLLQSWAT